MLSRRVTRQYFTSGSGGLFNVLTPFKTLDSVVYQQLLSITPQIRTPLKHFRAAFLSQDGVYKPTWTNLTTEAFDEVAHEWHAAYFANPYHLQIYNNFENIQTVNFGTVDNPCVIFTADAPFRYVGCTGLQNEDDYEGHEMKMFMLREGPMQRCGCCGQVFKLVRLRDRYDEEMQFYEESFHPIDSLEFDNENSQIMNLLKMNTHHETSYHEVTPTQDIVSAVEPDQHDRILVDPAYRLWRFKTKQETYKVIASIMQEVGFENHDVNPRVRINTTKLNYETSIEAEKALAILQRQQSRFARFQVRELLDYDNHERRERRMLANAKQRWENNYTYFFGGLTEEEQRYNDYYKTDNELEVEDELMEQRLDQFNILALPDYNPKRFDFQEGYTHNPEDDQSSLLDKFIFNFTFRQANDPIQLFQQRQSRMIQRQLLRNQSLQSQAIFKSLQQAYQSADQQQIQLAEAQFYSFASQEALLMYADYYEGDNNAQTPLLQALQSSNPLSLLPIYKNYAAQIHHSQGYQSFPKPLWDTSKGVLSNLVTQFNQLQTIAPQAKTLENQSYLHEVYYTYYSYLSQMLPRDEQELFQLGLIEAQQQAQKVLEQKKKSKKQSSS